MAWSPPPKRGGGRFALEAEEPEAELNLNPAPAAQAGACGAPVAADALPPSSPSAAPPADAADPPSPFTAQIMCTEELAEELPEPGDGQEEEDGAFFLPRRRADGQSNMSRKIAQLQPSTTVILGSDLMIHRSGLERATAAAKAKAAAGAASPRRAALRAAAASAGAASGALGADLVVHKCGLERASEAAKAAAAAAGRPEARGVKRAASEAAAGPGLGEDLLVHKCGLERASEAAKAANEARPEGDGGRGAAREKEGWDAWGALPLAAVQKKHMSKMEREVQAWKEAAKRKEGQAKRP